MLFRLLALLTDEAVPSGQNMEAGTIGHFSSTESNYRVIKYLIVLSITAVISRGDIIEIMPSCLDAPNCVKIDGDHTTTRERETAEALPTKPADHSPIDSPTHSPTADTQATSTQTPRPSGLSPAEGYDQLNATPPVKSSETYNYNSQVHSLTTPDSDRATLNSDRVTLNSDRVTLNSDRATLNSDRATLNSDRATLSSDRATPGAEGVTPGAEGATPGTEGATPGAEGATSIRVDPSTVQANTFPTTDGGTTRHSDTTTPSKVKTCGAFSCIGIACYKHMKATEVCQEGMAYCKLWRSVTQVTWNLYVTVWTAGCAARCGPREPCSAFSGYRCQQECCEARAASCLRLDGSVGAAAGAGSRSYAPLTPALMCVTSQLIGRLLS